MEGIANKSIYRILSLLLAPFRPLIILLVFQIQTQIGRQFFKTRTEQIGIVASATPIGAAAVCQFVFVLASSIFVLLFGFCVEWTPNPLKQFSQTNDCLFGLMIVVHKIVLSLQFALNTPHYHYTWDTINLLLSIIYFFYLGTRQRASKGILLAIENVGVSLIMAASLFGQFYPRKDASIHPIILLVLLFVISALALTIYTFQVRVRWKSIKMNTMITSKNSVYENLLGMFSVLENGSHNTKMLLIDWLLHAIKHLECGAPTKNIFNEDFARRFQNLIDSADSKKSTEGYLLELIDRYVDETISAYVSAGHFNFEEFCVLRIYFLSLYGKFTWRTIGLYFHFQKNADLSNWYNRMLSDKLLWELMTAFNQTNVATEQWYKLNLQKNIKVEKQYSRLVELIKESLASSRSLLFEFQRQHLYMSQAFNLFQDVFQRYRVIKELADRILSLDIFCKDFYLVYINYLWLVVNDANETEQVKNKLNTDFISLSSFKSKFDLAIQNQEFTDKQDKFYISISGNAKKLGLITSTSADCVRALKRQKRDFYGATIDSLKPRFLAGAFKEKVMSDLRDDNCLQSINMQRYLDIYIDADKYIIPTISCIKRYVDSKSALQYIIVSNIITTASDDNELLFSCDWQSGVLSHWSNKPSRFFGLDSLIFESPMLEQEEFNVNMFFPEFSNGYEDALRVGNPVTVEMSLAKFVELRLSMHHRMTAQTQIWTAKTFQQSLPTSLRSLNRLQPANVPSRMFLDEEVGNDNMIKIEIQLLAMFKASNREHGIVRCCKVNNDKAHVFKIEDVSFLKKDTTKVDSDQPVQNLLSVLSGKEQGTIPPKLTVFFKPSGSKTVLKGFFGIFIIGLIIFVALMIGKIRLYFDQMTITYNESMTLSSCPTIALNRIKKDDLEHSTAEVPDQTLQIYSEKYYIFEGINLSTLWKSVQNSYLSLMSKFYQSEGIDYSRITTSYVHQLSPNKSLVVYPLPYVQEFEGFNLPLSFADMNSFFQITFLKIDDPSFMNIYDTNTRRLYKEILERMHDFWEETFGYNIDIFQTYLNEFRDHQIIELCLVAFLLIVCIFSTEVIEFRMNKLFYLFACLTKREVNSFLAHSSKFERLLDPRKPLETELSDFQYHYGDLQPRLVAKNSSLNSDGEDEPSAIIDYEQKPTWEKSGRYRTQGFNQKRIREKEVRVSRAFNDRVKHANSQPLRPTITIVNRVAVIGLVFGLLAYFYFSHIQSVHTTDSYAMKHFQTISQISNHLEMIKYHAHYFMYLSDCEECKSMLEDYKFEIVECFKDLIVQADRIAAPGFDQYTKTLKSLFFNLCNQKFEDEHLNEKLKSDCDGNYTLNQGFETLTINLTDRYTKIINKPDKSELTELKIEIIVREFWIHHNSQRILRNFGSSLDDMKNLQQFSVIFFKAVFITMAAALCFFILQYRFYREGIQLEQNRFALNFLLSPIVVFNHSLREHFDRS